MTNEEIQILKQELVKHPGKYDLEDNSCATYTMKCLEKATKKSKSPIIFNPYAAGYILSKDKLSHQMLWRMLYNLSELSENPNYFLFILKILKNTLGFFHGTGD